MGGLECVITGLLDEFHYFFKKIHCNREIFTLIVISISFLTSLINVTPVRKNFKEINKYDGHFLTVENDHDIELFQKS